MKAQVALALFVGLLVVPAVVGSEEDAPREPNKSLQQAFDQFQKVSVKSDPQGRPASQTITLNQTAITIEDTRYDAFRFTVDRGALVKQAEDSSARPEDFDLIWYFVGPEGSRGWYITPKKGRMQGFRNFRSLKRWRLKNLQDLDPKDYPIVVLQRLGGENLIEGEEYLMRFQLEGEEPATMSFAIGFAYKTKADNSDLAERLGVLVKSPDELIAEFTETIRLNSDDADAYLRRATVWEEEGEPDKAIDDLTEAIRINSDDVTAYGRRATVWKGKGELDKAIDDLTQAIRIDSDDATAYGRRAALWKEKGEPDKAIDDLTEAIRIEPEGAVAFYFRGKVWHDKGEYDKAIQDFNEVVRLAPYAAVPLRDRGLAWYEKGEYDKAIQDYSEALRLDPSDALAFRKRGLAWHRKGEYDKAIQDYSEALRLDPSDALAFHNRGFAWFEKQQYDKAIEDYTEALRLDPSDPVTFRERGLAWRRKGDCDKAIQDYSEALRLDPSDALAFRERGLAWYKKRAYDKAIADHTESIRIVPDNPRAYTYRGWAWAEKDEYDKAIEDYTEAIRLSPDFADAYIDRADIWEEKSDYTKAIADYTEAIRIDPDDVEAYGDRSYAYERNEQYAQAIADRTQLIRLEHDLVGNHFYRGMLRYKKTKEYAEAIEDMTEVLRIRPDDKKSRQMRAVICNVADDEPGREQRLRMGIADLIRLLDSKPGHYAYAEYLYLRSEMRFRQGNRAQADADYREAMGVGPEKSLVWLAPEEIEVFEKMISAGRADEPKTAIEHLVLAKRALAVDDFKVAYRHAYRMTQLAPRDGRGYAYCAYILEEDDEREEEDKKRALALYDRAVRLNARTWLFYWLRGESKFIPFAVDRMTKGVPYSAFERVVEDYNAAIRLEPKAPALYLSRHLAYEMADETDKADQDLGRAVQLNSAFPIAGSPARWIWSSYWPPMPAGGSWGW